MQKSLNTWELFVLFCFRFFARIYQAQNTGHFLKIFLSTIFWYFLKSKIPHVSSISCIGLSPGDQSSMYTCCKSTYT